MTRGSEDRAADVLRLAYVDGLGVRTIARRLSMSRKTVRRLLGRDRPRARPRPNPEPRSSILDSFTPVIRDLLRETPEMKSPAVLERLRPLGYTGGISILRDRVRKLRPGGHREAFLTLDFAPGKAVQVDWADFGFAIPGCPRRVSAFVMALCYSRYLYLEFTLSQSMGSFLRCLQRGIAFYGGTTVVDIFDNMKTVVQDPKNQIFNPRFLQFAGARGFAAVACNPGKGNEKGRVERPIGFRKDGSNSPTESSGRKDGSNSPTNSPTESSAYRPPSPTPRPRVPRIDHRLLSRREPAQEFRTILGKSWRPRARADRPRCAH